VASRGVDVDAVGVIMVMIIVLGSVAGCKVQFVRRRRRRRRRGGRGMHHLVRGHSGQVGSRRTVLHHRRRLAAVAVAVAHVAIIATVITIVIDIATAIDIARRRRRRRLGIRMHHFLLTGNPLDHPRSDRLARRGRRSDRLRRLMMGLLVGHSARGGHFDDGFFSAAEVHRLLWRRIRNYQ